MCRTIDDWFLIRGIKILMTSESFGFKTEIRTGMHQLVMIALYYFVCLADAWKSIVSLLTCQGNIFQQREQLLRLFLNWGILSFDATHIQCWLHLLFLSTFSVSSLAVAASLYKSRRSFVDLGSLGIFASKDFLPIVARHFTNNALFMRHWLKGAFHPELVWISVDIYGFYG